MYLGSDAGTVLKNRDKHLCGNLIRGQAGMLTFENALDFPRALPCPLF